jgi:hypothetical protein
MSQRYGDIQSVMKMLTVGRRSLEDAHLRLCAFLKEHFALQIFFRG